MHRGHLAALAAALLLLPAPAVAQSRDVAAGWVDTGVGRFVEVMLVDGCVAELPDGIPTDPCASREDLLFHVAADGTITTIASSVTPAAP